MKFLIALSLVLIASINMSDLTANTALLDTKTQRPTTLFSVDSQYEQIDTSANELWESTIYQVRGFETQVRWSKEGSFVSAAKSCTFDGQTVVAQVTMDLNAPRVQYSAVETNQGLCEITLSHTDNNNFFIQDEDLIFSGENGDGTVELSVLVNDDISTDAVFQKIAG